MTNIFHRRSRALVGILASFLIVGALVEQGGASVLLEFSGGGSSAVPVTNQVDAFTGATGQGWASSWVLREQTAANSNISAAVVSGTAFGTGEGNYLAVQYESLSGSNARAGVVRRFSTNPADGGVNPAQTFSLSFDFRVDAFSGVLNQSTDQILFSTGITDAASGFAATSPLRIWYVGGTGWQVNDGNTYVTIPGLSTSITAGLVYDFDVTINAATGTWDFSVGYNGSVYSLNNLDLWASTDVATANYLSLRGMRTTRGTLNWSIDNIQAVPEPGTVTLLFAGAIGFILFRRKWGRVRI